MTMRRLLLILLTLALVTMAGVIYFQFDPSQHKWFPRCLFLTLTGYQCPGCGTQRALHALLHGQWSEAWHYNAGLLIALPVLAIYLLGEIKRTAWPRYYRAISHPLAVNLIPVALVAWWILRNL